MRCKYLSFSLVVVTLISFAETISAPPPAIEASSYFLVDANTNKIIAEKKSDERMPPASLTKIMTSYVVENQIQQGLISPTDEVPISVKAWRAEGSKMFIREGTTVLLSDLLKGVIIQSGNDASIALAEYVAGDEKSFAQMMNSQAEYLGMSNTHFMNSTGLPNSAHFSSARDLARLTASLIEKYPEHYKTYAERSFKFNNINQPNRNRLLRYDRSVDGVKTGYTKAAGYCLVASSERDGMRLISVVMGAGSDDARVKESQKLLKYGFRNYETLEIYGPTEAIKTSRIFFAEEDEIDLGVPAGVIVTIPRGQYKKLQAEMNIPKILEAPIFQGEVVGELTLKISEEIIYRTSLVAMATLERTSFLGGLSDHFELLFMDE